MLSGIAKSAFAFLLATLPLGLPLLPALPVSASTEHVFSVPVRTCPTQFGAGQGPYAAPKTSTEVRVTSTPTMPLAVYRDASDTVEVVAPLSWTCQAIVSGDGSPLISVAPSKPATYSGMPEGIQALVIPACTGCIYDELCPFFSTSALDQKLYGPCPTKPPSSEEDRKVSGRVVEFTDPPGVDGTWDNKKSPYKAAGAVVDEAGAALVACALPPRDRPICRVAIRTFVSYRTSDTRPPSIVPGVVEVTPDGLGVTAWGAPQVQVVDALSKTLRSAPKMATSTYCSAPLQIARWGDLAVLFTNNGNQHAFVGFTYNYGGWPAARVGLPSPSQPAESPRPPPRGVRLWPAVQAWTGITVGDTVAKAEVLDPGVTIVQGGGASPSLFDGLVTYEVFSPTGTLLRATDTVSELLVLDGNC